jgi:hypothetical protein
MLRNLATLLALVAGCLLADPASSLTLIVDAQANIFGAGHAAPPPPASGGAGLLPPSMSFGPGQFQILQFTLVAGQVTCCGDLGGLGNGPDGGIHASGTTDILSVGGIAGIVNDSRTMFMVGVFLGPDEPADPAPARLDFGSTGVGMSFPALAPEIAQVFFIGDGVTGPGTGDQQVFYIPAAATRLFLGFADAVQFGNPQDPPGSYEDNLGELVADFELLEEPPVAARSTTWGTLKRLYR